MNRQRLDSPLVYVGAHNVYYVKLPAKVLYFTIHIHTQINQYVVAMQIIFHRMDIDLACDIFGDSPVIDSACNASVSSQR